MISCVDALDETEIYAMFVDVNRKTIARILFVIASIVLNLPILANNRIADLRAAY